MEKELFIKEVRSGVYLMDEAHEATGYLVVGNERACVIDTMNGHNDLYEAVRKITDKPVTVVNTHGHPDHIFGNMYFQEAYLNPEDGPLARQFTEDPEFLAFYREKGRTMPPFRDIFPAIPSTWAAERWKYTRCPAIRPAASCCCSGRTGSSLRATASTTISGCSWTAACPCANL